MAKTLEQFPGLPHDFVCTKTFLLLTLKAETRCPRKKMMMMTMIKLVTDNKVHQDSITKASVLAHCKVLEKPEAITGGEETEKAWKKITVRWRRSMTWRPGGTRTSPRWTNKRAVGTQG